MSNTPYGFLNACIAKADQDRDRGKAAIAKLAALRAALEDEGFLLSVVTEVIDGYLFPTNHWSRDMKGRTARDMLGHYRTRLLVILEGADDDETPE